jgi:hypothetical protein
MTESIKMSAPAVQIPYVDNGGSGGAYMCDEWSKKIGKFEAGIPYPPPHKFTVEVMEGFARDAGVTTVCSTDDLTEASESYAEWQKACPYMVAVMDRDTFDQVEPYGYG